MASAAAGSGGGRDDRRLSHGKSKTLVGPSYCKSAYGHAEPSHELSHFHTTCTLRHGGQHQHPPPPLRLPPRDRTTTVELASPRAVGDADVALVGLNLLTGPINQPFTTSHHVAHVP